MRKLFIALLVAAGAFPYLACDDDHDHDDGHSHADGGHSSTVPSCDEIIKACHEYDEGQGGPISDCHSKAHEPTATDAVCAPIKADCLAACAAAAAAAADAATGG